ncbi:hypothetical protein HT031_001437 [Scenedesmus sp. PABB004]|nr:hypothetical protein HT031_001437 [Scenedesmus sp. PABB004]
MHLSAAPCARGVRAAPAAGRAPRRCSLRCRADADGGKRGTLAKQAAPPAAPPARGGAAATQQAATQQAEQQQQGWRVFSWAAYQEAPWDVPWGGGTVAATMAVWAAGFAGTAFLAVPALYVAASGVPLSELGPAGQADFALWSEVAELAVTAAILGSVAARCGAGRQRPGQAAPTAGRPRAPPPQPTAPLAALTARAAAQRLARLGLIGAAGAPLVVGSTAALLSALGYDTLTSGGHGTVDGVAGMISMDTPTYARLLAVTGLLAPVLEESLFRGFLLTSLTKVMPPWAAVLASATAFGLAHLSLRDLPVLIALGCWLGAIYCRSRNLLTPMLVHGAWNGGVLSLLFWLTANGVDVQQLLKDGQL